jgi:mRNA-degrading endonuclease toxin of MazEF toxin-antitoxin module
VAFPRPPFRLSKVAGVPSGVLARSPLARFLRRKPVGEPARRVGRDDVQVTYDPHPDGKPDPGEVVWVWIPYEDDPTRGKDRPSIVIGSVGTDVAVVPLTSKRHPGQVVVGSGSWDKLSRQSEAKVDQIYVIPRADVRREGSSLDRAVFDRVIAALA